MSIVSRNSPGRWIGAGLLAALVVGGGAAAEPWPFTKIGEGLGASAEQCQKVAETAAMRAALRSALTHIAGTNNLLDADLDKFAETVGVITSAKVIEANSGGGRCIAKLRLLIDSAALTNAVAAGRAATVQAACGAMTRVGLLIRYRVDGRDADGRSFNVQDAQSELGKNLKDYNIEVTTLDEFTKLYQRSQVTQETALAGDDGIVNGTDDESDAWVKEMTKKLREMIRGQVGSGDGSATRKEIFDYITLGTVDITSKGRDPQSPNYLAEVRTHVSLRDISGSTDAARNLGDSGTKSGLVPGETPSLAITNAMKQSLATATAVIAGQIDQALRQTQAATKTYSITITNIQNERPQLRTIENAISNAGIKFSTDSGILDNTAVIPVSFSGTLLEFKDAVNTEGLSR